MPNIKSDKSPEEELASLLERAMENPGVADAMQVYQAYESLEKATRPYFQIANMPRLYSVTDSVSH